MYIYKIAYAQYEEQGYVYLQHNKQFTSSELLMMIFECVKDLVSQGEYNKTSPCILSFSDFFGEFNNYTIGRMMVKKYGFTFFHFEASIILDDFSIFKKDGFADIFNISPKKCEVDCSREFRDEDCRFLKEE